MSVNIDFEFDFEAAIKKAYLDDEIYQQISDLAKGLDMKSIRTEEAIRSLIEINSKVLANVLNAYNKELLNEL